MWKRNKKKPNLEVQRADGWLPEVGVGEVDERCKLLVIK